MANRKLSAVTFFSFSNSFSVIFHKPNTIVCYILHSKFLKKSNLHSHHFFIHTPFLFICITNRKPLILDSLSPKSLRTLLLCVILPILLSYILYSLIFLQQSLYALFYISSLSKRKSTTLIFKMPLSSYQRFPISFLTTILGKKSPVSVNGLSSTSAFSSVGIAYADWI